MIFMLFYLTECHEGLTPIIIPFSVRGCADDRSRLLA